nr:hypothetical protein [Gemmatimonadota bacterium]NIQ57231.1 hypothetical protein [Gemmatimonadota bacterium]NIU77401.1 hypothetical protein [Gammaproteobacteria bacterium]NIX46644.1 hypothetical protein [Gemmatimonadota bacterium]NIY10985.1 hypothetical protein [Gemmatimonadota bacterium]
MHTRRSVSPLPLLASVLVLGACAGEEIDEATRARVVAVGDPAAMLLI